MTPLPIVLVGCGAVSQLFYAPALRALEATGLLRVTALVDPVEAARERLQQFFPHVPGAATLVQVDTPRVCLAIIASPPRWHAEQTLAALARGWHVLCEKPMAATSAEAEQMISAAEAAGQVLAVGHYKRFFPSSHYLKFLCGPAGPLGALQSFSIAEGGPFTWPAASPAFFQKKETPGGVLLDIGVHVLDLLLWWLGDPADFTYADDAMGGLEANARVSLRFGSTTGRVQLSRDWATTQRYDFEFKHGNASWTVNDANGLSMTLAGAPFALQGTLRETDGTAAATNPQSFIAQLQHVVTAVHNRTPVLVDGREGVRALRLIEACYARRQLLKQPWFNPAELSNAHLRAVNA
ncbi:MAG TPA: Gfo/Idh/MocA family oxidoreductase [Opitutaceae bacterium]|jgi:predicted dehydrogenase|nr:Gfo/Idh/MocA family oxidoreductase [Opitutaceae bacterium]